MNFFSFALGLWKSKDVSFRANVPLKTRLDGGEKIIFTDTPVNNGRAYDNNTGIFIAPVTGTYFFVLQLCLNDNFIDLSIQKGEMFFSWARFNPFMYLSCQSVDLLIPLQKGEEVYTMKDVSWNTDIMNDSNKLFNAFSGVLIA